MKNIKKLIALLLCVLFLVTVPVFNAFASETDSEQIEYCMSGPAVARELNADGTEHIIVGKPGPVTVKKTHILNFRAQSACRYRSVHARGDRSEPSQKRCGPG